MDVQQTVRSNREKSRVIEKNVKAKHSFIRSFTKWHCIPVLGYVGLSSPPLLSTGVIWKLMRKDTRVSEFRGTRSGSDDSKTGC